MMEAMMATVKNGRIVLDSIPDWPEGCRVMISLVAEGEELEPMEEIEPLILTLPKRTECEAHERIGQDADEKRCKKGGT